MAVLDRVKPRSGVVGVAVAALTLGLMTGVAPAAGAAVPTLTSTPYGNLSQALAESLYFFDAEKSGPARSTGHQPLEWRGDSEPTDSKIPLTANAGTDGLASTGTNLPAALITKYKSLLDPDGDGTVDLSGGFHDAGDHVKFGLPQAYAASTLAWGVYEFKNAYAKTGVQDHVMEELRWFTDYFLRSTFRDSSGKVVAFNYMVGRGGVDHTYWGPPELQDGAKYPRPATFAYPAESGWKAAPASDQAAQTAAALALMSLITKDTDATYAAKCLEVAKSLYTFAVGNRGLGNGDGFYPSASDADDLSWAAVWLYQATGTAGYITDITAKGTDGNYTGYLKAIVTSVGSTWQNIWVHSWDAVWGGVFAKLAPLSKGVVPDADNAEYWYYFRWNAEYWSGGSVKHTAPAANDTNFLTPTPGGFGVVNTWGSARYNAAAQLQALVYRKYSSQDPGGSTAEGEALTQWALSQMNYIMGNNPLHRSFIVGYTAKSGDTYAQHPHHRASHGSSNNNMNVPATHRHVLWGGLVGGPDATDAHNDVTTDYVLNEVAVDYNAGLAGALAGLYEYFGSGQDVVSWKPPAEPTETPYTASAKIEQENDQRTQITVQVSNTATHPPAFEDGLSLRYYFDISEMIAKGQDISAITVDTYYDQSKVNGSPAKISAPVAVDAAKGLYYVSISWEGVPFAGTLDYQFGLVAAQDSSWKSNWDPSNDYSHSGLSKTAITLAPKIPVYRDGTRVYGTEPDGTEPTTSPSPSVSPSGSVSPSPSVSPTVSITPSPSVSPTVSITPSPTGSGRACTAAYSVTSQWSTGFQGQVVVRNSGTAAISHWTLAWTLPSGQTVSQIWNGTMTTSGSQVTVTDLGWNGNLATGASTTVGLLATSTSASPTIPTVTCTAT